MEYASGELCFIYSPICNKRIRCWSHGSYVGMTTKNAGWEVWRFVEDEDGSVFISSWTHSNKFLSSSPDGKVFASKNKLELEKWKVQKDCLGRDGILIKSLAHNRYLCCNGNDIHTVDYCQNEGIVWQLEAGHQNRFFISSPFNDKKIGVSESSIYSTTKELNWEKWSIKFVDDCNCAIYSKTYDKYISSNSAGDLYMASHVGEYEKWRLEQSDNGPFYIVSSAHRRYLGCNHEDEIDTKKDVGDSQLWNLEPCMPWTLSANQLNVWIAAGAIGLGVTIAMPFAVMGIIGGMGFTSGGIAAGSTAAGMMSAEAIASGGAVAAGGTVATLQSIGATGLGVAGTSAAVGGGAALGGTIVGGTVGITSISLSHGNTVTNGHNRHFCMWRTWT